jgi:hypothetical protein
MVRRDGILRDGIPRTSGGNGTVRYRKIMRRYGTVRYDADRKSTRYETVLNFCNTVSLWSDLFDQFFRSFDPDLWSGSVRALVSTKKKRLVIHYLLIIVVIIIYYRGYGKFLFPGNSKLATSYSAGYSNQHY